MLQSNLMPTKAELKKNYVNNCMEFINSILDNAEVAIMQNKARKAERLIERAQRFNNHLQFINS